MVATLLVLLHAATASANSAVGNVVATPGNGNVQLTWTNPPDADFDHVNIYRSTSKYGAPTLVQAVPKPATTWTDATAVNGTDYWYSLRAATVANAEAVDAVGGGILSSWYSSTAYTTIIGQRLDPTINYPTLTGNNPFGQATNFGVRWTGYVYVPTSETYTIYHDHDDTGRVYLDGVLQLNNACCGEQSIALAMSTGWHRLQVDLDQATGSWREILQWSTPTLPKQVIPAADLGIEHTVAATPRNATVTVTAPNGGETVTQLTNVTWTTTGTVDHWEIEGSSDGGATWAQLTGFVPGASTSWAWEPPVDTTNPSWRIRVRAVSQAGVLMASDASDANFTVNTPPAPPISNLAATAGVAQVALSWTNPVATNFDHVQVLRSTQEGDPGVVVYTSANSTVNSWTDTSVSNGTRYYYRVRSVTPTGVTGPTIAPGSFTGSYYVENGATEFNELLGSRIETIPLDRQYSVAAHLPFSTETEGVDAIPTSRWDGFIYVPSTDTWKFQTNHRYTKHRIWLDGTMLIDNWTAWSGGTSTLVTRSLAPGWHHFRMEAKEMVAGNSAYVQLYTATSTGTLQIVPMSRMGREPWVAAMPTTTVVNLTSPVGGEQVVSTVDRAITWTAPGPDASMVDIWLSLDGGVTWPHLLARNAPNTGTWTWRPPAGVSSTQARVRVIAKTGGGVPVGRSASASDFTIDTTGGTLVSPSNLQAVANGPGKIDVSWTMPSPLGSVDHVNVYRQPDDGSDPVLVYTSPDGTTSTWSDVAATNGIRYRYFVRSVSATGREARAWAPGGLDGSFYSDTALTVYEGSQPMTTAFDLTFPTEGPALDETQGRLFSNSNLGARWTGAINVTTPGTYTLSEYSRHDYRRLFIDGRAVINSWTGAWNPTSLTGTLYLTAGWHTLRMEQAAVATDYLRTQLMIQLRGSSSVVVPAANLGREAFASAVANASSITLTSPNGGEVWRGQRTRTITWTSTGGDVASVNVRLSTDGGVTWPNALARRIPDTGSFTWMVPGGMNTSQARFRVEAVAASGRTFASDASDADLTLDASGAGLAPTSNLNAVATNPGEITVSWTMPSPLGSADHVNVYREPGEGQEPVLVYTSPNASVTSWVDTGLPSGVRQRYMVRTADAAGNELRNWVAGALDQTWYSDTTLSTYEASDVMSTVFDLTTGVDGPLLDATQGRIYSTSNTGVRWTGAINIPTGDTYTLSMYSRHDFRRLYIDGNALINSWSGAWNPASLTATVFLTPGWHTLRMEQGAVATDYMRSQLWLQERGASNALVAAASLGREVTASAVTTSTSVTVTSPNGGEQIRRQGPTPITWTTAGGDATNVTIRASVDNGATWPIVVARRVANTGSYNWYVPGLLSAAQALIRVEGVTSTGWTVARDDSNAPFSIEASGPGLTPVTAVTASAGGPGQINVGWTMPSPLGSVARVKVYRAASGSEPALVYTSPDATTTSWIDTGVVDGQRYTYTVRTLDAAGNESRSYEAGALDYAAYRDNSLATFDHAGTLNGTFDVQYPSWGQISPTTPNSTCTTCSMRWTGAIYVPTSNTYTLAMYSRHNYRRFWFDDQPVISTWDGGWNPTSQTFTQFITAGWHSIRIEQAQASGDYLRAQLNWATRGNALALIPMANLGRERTASAVATSTQVTLSAPNGGESWMGNTARTVSWSAVGAPVGATYRIGYSTDGGVTWPYTVAGQLSGTSVSFKPPESLSSTTVRFYVEVVALDGQVRARDESDANLSVDASSATTSVTNLTATPAWQQVALSWTNPADAGFDHVNIYRSTTPTALGTKVQVVAKPGTSWTNTGLTNGTAYYYTVRAADAADVERISIQSGGLRGYYYSDNAFTSLAATQVDPVISFDWGWGGGPAALGAQADNFSIRWVGYINSATVADWIYDGSPTRDALRVDVNGQRVVDSWNLCDCDANNAGHQQLAVGWHPIKVEYMETTGYARVYLYRQSSTAARVIVPASALGTERTAAATPGDITPPSPNPVGAATADSPTQITWNAIGATDTESGLAASAYSYDNGTTWTNQVTWARTGLTPNTSYTQTVKVRDAAGNMTTPKVVTARTLPVDPSVSSSQPANTWLGPGAVSITFSNLVAFGAGGVEQYRWAFNQNTAYTFDNTEAIWSTGNLVRTVSTSGDWYLHVRSYNADGVPGATVRYGPFRIDSSAPTPNPATVTWSSTLSDVNFSISPITDAESGIPTNAYSWDGGTTWGATPTSGSTGLTPNTTVVRSVRTRDVVGNVSAISTVTGATLPVDPSASSSPVAGATWRPGNTTFTLTSSVAFGPGTLAKYRYRLTSNATDAITLADPSWNSGTQAVAIGPTGTWYVRLRSYNAVDDGGTTITLGPFNVDATPPPATTVTAPSPTAAAPALSWTAVVDGESGVANYKVYRSTSAGTLGSLVASVAAASTSWSDPATLVDDTTYYYTVQPIDQVGNEQVVGNTQTAVTFASAAPSGASVVIDGGASAVGSTGVTLGMVATNAASMQLSNAPDFAGATWVPFNATAGWTLSAGSGTKTVYARFRNAGGTVSASVSDTVLLDQDAPTPNPPSLTAVANSSTQATWTSTAASDVGAGLPAAPYSFDDGNTWQAGVGFVRTGLTPNTSYSAVMRARDALGNVTASRTTSVTTLASAPSITSSPLPDPANQPRGTTFTFTNTAGWGAGGVEYYRYAWDTSTTHVFAGTEAMWTSSTLARQELVAGTYYLHVQAFNSANDAGATLDYGPFNIAPPITPADLTVNVADTQTLSCAKTDFTGSLLPGDQRDATVDCTVTSGVAGWNLQAHASAAPLLNDFVDMPAAPAAYTAPAAGVAQVGFTMTGAKSDAAFSAGSLWRGFAGATDIRIAGDTGTSSGDTVTMRIRAHLGTSSGLTAGARTGTITYTLNPGP
jgi:hypothetical protein